MRLKIHGRVLALRLRAEPLACCLCLFVFYFGTWFVEAWWKVGMPLHPLSVVTVTVLSDQSDIDHLKRRSRVQNTEWKTTRLKKPSLNPVILLILAAAYFLICICSEFQMIEKTFHV